eukprot:TRINITY_DN7294_c0_g1_i2.p1 TRINITY_DN7294_c0_g1~~TRINITY_DN7294_c0_g1_i2.p1  ORF type:complete len:190 (+),score=28.67 TRINITY_DN7294_c0_g1_i2:75-572(+)
MAPIIAQYARTRARKVVAPSTSISIASAMQQLADFMFVRGTPKRERQKLLRNYGIIELLVEMLQAPFGPNDSELESGTKLSLRDLHRPQHEDTLRVLNAAYNVIEVYLKGNSRKNELYMARHIPFFQSQVQFFPSQLYIYMWTGVGDGAACRLAASSESKPCIQS